MSAMNSMLADILKKAMGPEAAAFLTEENMSAFKKNAEGLVLELREGIANCQRQNIEILERLERIENDGRNDSGGAERPRSRKRANDSATDTGSGNE